MCNIISIGMMHLKSLFFLYPSTEKTTDLPHERCYAFLNDDEGGRRLAGAAAVMAVFVRCFLFYLSSSFFSSR